MPHAYEGISGILINPHIWVCDDVPTSIGTHKNTGSKYAPVIAVEEDAVGSGRWGIGQDDSDAQLHATVGQERPARLAVEDPDLVRDRGRRRAVHGRLHLWDAIVCIARVRPGPGGMAS